MATESTLMQAILKTHLGPWRPQVLAILRVMTALLFLEHGTMKLFGFPASQMPVATAFTFIWWAGVIELVGAILLLVGLFTRITAFILSGEMAVAYFYAHAPRSFFPAQNSGETAILLCFIFLYIAAAGPGAFAIDRSRTSA
jgi:putative oxidoreductase